MGGQMDLFQQFSIPTWLGVPLPFLLVLLMPVILMPRFTDRVISNRFETLTVWFIEQFLHQIFSPLNEKARQWAGMLTSLMLFFMILNLLSLLPYVLTPTAHLSFTLGFSIPLWLATVLIGLRHYTTRSLAHLLPEGTPAPLIPPLILIETTSLFIRPLSLGVRMSANLTAGHILIYLGGNIILSILATSPVMALTLTGALCLFYILEAGMAVLQAYVFVLLLSLYLQENT